MDTFERSDIHFVNAELSAFTKEKQTASHFTHKQDSSRRLLLALNFRQMILCVQLKAIVHVEWGKFNMIVNHLTYNQQISFSENLKIWQPDGQY